MSEASNVSSRPVYEIDVEPESGINLSTGEHWTGWRVRYRPLGSRGRWTKFLAIDGLDAYVGSATIEQLQDLCRLHAEAAK